MLLNNKVALITGASSGIGKATSKLFAENGAKLILLDVNENEGKKLENSLLSEGYEVKFIACDVSKEKEVQSVFKTISNIFGTLTTVVASAGLDQISPIHQTSIDDWQKIIDVNLTGVFLTNKFAIIEMLKNKYGSIINISSIIGHVGQENISSYAASKGGVTNLTRSAAVTYAEQGIRVNAVCPGYIKTNLLTDLTEEMVKERVDRHPMKRMGTPEEVAEACLFLASDKSSFITGENLMVDGGYTAQ